MKNTGGARQGFQLKEKTKKNIFIVGMLAVAIANFLVFWFYLNFNSILLAFKEKQANGSYTLTLNNFVKLFQEFGNPDGHFRESIANTLIFFFFSLLIILPISILISYFIYKKYDCINFIELLCFYRRLYPLSY